MAKGKKARRGRKGKKDATDVNPETGQAMLIPAPRDLKHHMTVIAIAKAKADKANKELSHAYKVADEAGVNVKALRDGMRLMAGDALKQKSYVMQLSLVLQEGGASVQIDVHQSKSEDAVAEAKVKGFADGKAGRDKDHPWMKGSPAARQYEESYAEAQLENMPIDASTKAALKGKGKLALVE